MNEDIDPIKNQLFKLSVSPLKISSGTTPLFLPSWESDTNQRSVENGDSRRRLKILVVEDDNDVRYVMEMTLYMMGCAAVSCSNAELASSAFRYQEEVALLVTDIDLPGGSGVELARELCKLRSCLSVLIVSGRWSSNDFTRETRERGWHFLVKPHSIAAFAASVDYLLRTASANDTLLSRIADQSGHAL